MLPHPAIGNERVDPSELTLKAQQVFREPGGIAPSGACDAAPSRMARSADCSSGGLPVSCPTFAA